MSITSNGLYGTVDPLAGHLNISEGNVTITSVAGGFDVTFGQYKLTGDGLFFTPVYIGATTSKLDDNRANGPASLTLVGGEDGVNVSTEDKNVPRFGANVNVGADGRSQARLKNRN